MLARSDTPTLDRAVVVHLVSGCVALLAAWRTGLAIALPAGFGLTHLAATDLATRRVPRPTVRLTAAAIGAASLIDIARKRSAQNLLRALLLTLVVGLLAALAWSLTKGIALGDVKLLALAAFVPAWLSTRAVVVTIVAAWMAAAVVVGLRAAQGRDVARSASIAFGPPLLVGWLVGVMTA
jgi:prepilin signal peptidase PulO-like enzyme (type II secretory pathway)